MTRVDGVEQHSERPGAWWRDAVVYQVYPRSFQDSDGDGVGDLPGIAARLDHLVTLGVDALWLSPVYPSPLADFGYDVSDFTGVDPAFGTLADLDALLAAAHARGLRVLMDLVPCHTSIEHPWFAEHPDWYVRMQGDGPPNNWVATFGGPAWSPDPLRPGWWYLHSFYPEQPDLDWSNPEVVAAMQQVVRFWLERGVDGFRLDAIDRLAKDPQLRDDPPLREPLPLPEVVDSGLQPLHSRNGPGIEAALAALRAAAGDRLLVGEVYLPTPRLAPYLAQVDAAFSFELLHAPFEPAAIAAAIRSAQAPELNDGVGWVLSNHDFPRLPNRVGPGRERLAALLLLTLPGLAFVYQGDEIGLPDGPGATPPYDRAGRDRHRHPMQWDGSPTGGFSAAAPWLAPIDPATRNVADQERDRGSLLWLYRAAIALRRTLGDDLELIEDVPAGVVAYRRGEHAVVVLNLGEESVESPVRGELLLDTAGRTGGDAPASLGPRSGHVVATDAG